MGVMYPDEIGKDGQVIVMRDGEPVWEYPDEESSQRAELAELRARVAQLEAAARALLDAIGLGASEYTNLGAAMQDLQAVLDGNATPAERTATPTCDS